MQTLNKYIKTFVFIGIFAFASIFFMLQGNSNTFSVKTPLPSDTNKRKLPVYLRYYPYVNYVYNYIQWYHFPQVSGLFDLFGETINRRLTILHIGDSHIQADVYTGHIREQMQRTFGAGGRGLVFPYDAANTHSTLDYKTHAWGKWQYAKNINQFPKYDLGIAGATINTDDSTAGFKFIFRSGIMRSHFKTIKVFCKTNANSFNLLVTTSKQSEPISVVCNKSSLNGVVEFQLPVVTDTLAFQVVKNTTEQNFFECYGVLIESENKTGVLYNSVGINGAGLKSILRQNLMAQQLKVLKPDLVIIDLGANDFFQTDIDTTEVKENLLRIMSTIRTAYPQAYIILSNSQDVKCKTPNSCAIFSHITREVAFNEKCLFYDYFNICGGKQALLKWSADSLVKRDLIHLTKEGYQLKGELYLNGILNSYQTYLSTPDVDSFIIEAFKKKLIDDTIKEKPLQKEQLSETMNEPANTKTVYYKIKKGDALSKIAYLHGVSTKDLMRWNNITSQESIKEGKTLIIYLNNDNQ